MVLRAAILLILSLLSTVSCFAKVQDRKLVVLFTSDVHSVLLPGKDGKGGLVGIDAVVQHQREQALKEDAAFLLVDGGDIAMGTVFHTAFSEDAIEYRAMSRIGYDAVAVGNHDFDFGLDAFARMLAAAYGKDSCMKHPAVVSANLHIPGADVHRFRIFEKNGLKIGVTGLMGQNAFNVVSQDKEKLGFDNPVKAAGEVVEEMKLAGCDYMIALSHGGTLNGDDIKLARKVGGFDFIVSAHDHCLLEEPVKIGNTCIGAAGAGAAYVGKAVFEGGKLVSYELLPANGNLHLHGAFGRWVDSMYNVVGERFERYQGRGLNDTLATIDVSYNRAVDENGRMPLGDNVAQSYKDVAAACLPDVAYDDIISVVPYGVIRKGLNKGVVTLSDAFEVLSLGENENGFMGYPLVYAWLSGREVRDLCEMTLSVASSLEDMRLFFAGIKYRYNGARLPFIRTDRILVGDKPLDPDKLYPVVTGEYTARLMGLLEKESFGILSAQAKDADGNVLEDGAFFQLLTSDGKQIPEWVAFAQYIQQGKLDPKAGDDAVENDDFVPLGYTLAAIVLCALILFCMRKKEGRV